MNELATTDSLITEINARASLARDAATGIMQTCMDSANAIRECGIFLLRLKEQTPHGQWLGLFATADGKPNPTPVLDLDAQTGRRYMAFCRAYPEPFTDPQQAIGAYREIYRSSGLLPEREKDATRQTPADGWLSGLIDAVGKINRIADKHEIATAPDEVKSTFIERARPVVRLFFEAGGKV